MMSSKQGIVKCPIELPDDEVSDTTKMPKDMELGKKDCFGFASQDDSSNVAGKIICILLIEYF